MSRVDSDQVQIYSYSDKPYGKTYGQWTVEWWRWAYSMSKSQSPLLDTTGEKSSINQPENDVWFLAGIFGTDGQVVLPKRKISIPYGRSILFPVINCEKNSIEDIDLKTDADLIRHVREDEDNIVRKDAFINGIKLPVERIPSDPLVFELTYCHDNARGVVAGTARAAADGYYVFLKPLPKGNYDIQFRGSCEAGRLNSGANYQLAVL